jgi:PBSX family phage terminase large subunit
MQLVLSPKQIESYQQATARINLWVGAVRSGKTFSSQWALVKMCHSAPDGDLILVGKTSEAIERNIINQFLNEKSFRDLNVHYYSGKRRLMLEGRMIHCVGASDERAEGKIRGPTFSGAYVDEVTLIPESFFKMLISRLSYKKDEARKQLLGTTNPDSPFHWLKKDFIDRADELDLKVFNFKMTDNPSLHPEYIEALKKEYRGLWYRRFIDGEWCLAEGSVYDFFDESIHVIDSPPSYAKYYIVGVDYGTTNPCAFTLIGFNDESPVKIWVQKEYYFDSKKEGRQKVDAEYADDFFEFISDYPIKAVYIDPSAASFKLELRRRSSTLTIKDADNDVLNGIRVVSLRLATGDLKVCRCCKNLIQEFQSYTWDAKKAARGIDEPMHAFNHALDGTRYAIATHWGNKKDLRELSQEQRAFESWKKEQAKNSPWANPKMPGKQNQFLRPR